MLGRWDAALASTDYILSQLVEGETHYLEPDARPVRAWIEFARDQASEALADAGRAAEVAARSRDPQSLTGSLCVRTFLLLATGARTEALACFEELLAIGDGVAPGLNVSGNLPTFAWVALDLDRRGEAERVVRGSESPRWKVVAEAILAPDPVTAADLLREIGHRPAEAYARLRAGGRQLHAALEFYRSVEATRYIREAESQLAASA